MNNFIDKIVGFLDAIQLWFHNLMLMFETAFNFLYELINVPLELTLSVPSLLGFSIGLTMVIFVIRFLLLK